MCIRDRCYTDLQQSATIYSLRTGVDIPDFTDTDYMNIVIEVLERSIMDFWYRMFWFKDKDAKNVSDSGIITDGLDLKFFTISNGFWKQITTQATANASQGGATIAENVEASYAAQKLTPDKAKQYIQSVAFRASDQSSAPVVAS